MTLSPVDLQKIVKVAVTPQATLLDYKIVPYSENRHGIMGDHFALTIRTTGPGEVDTRTLQLFVKVPAADPVLRERIVEASVFLEEVNFFRRVVPLLRHVSQGSGIGVISYQPPAWCPLHYIAKPSMLVQEDLRAQGYSMRTESIFDEPTLQSALTTLARFHASTLLAENSGAGKFDLSFPDMFKEKIYTDVGKGGRSNKLGFDTMQLLADRFGLDGSILSEILLKVRELVKPVEGRCNVICHGDLWRSNLMFKYEESTLRCMLVDFQMLRYASPTIDVAMLLYVHASPDLRKSSEIKLLQYYYTALKDAIDKSPATVITVPTFEEIQEDYDERRIIGMAYSAQRWPPSVINNRHDIDTLENWYFNNRIDTYNKLMDADPKLEKRMKGYLQELIEEGHRILAQ